MALLPGRAEPLFLTRLEHNEHRFIEDCDGDADGVVINLRFDSPPKHGRLKKAALGKRLPFVIDIETWRLPFIPSSEDESFDSDLRTPLAAAVPLPLTPDAFDDASALERFVRLAVQVQVGALYTFAPYFLVTSLEDPWIDVNLRSLEKLKRLAPRQPLAAWVYVDFEGMTQGLVPYLAERYRRVLPPGSVIVLTVSDMRAEERSAQEIANYLEAIQAFRANGLHVIADRASEISVAAVAGGAGGCMLGNRIYRTAPASPIWNNPYNPAIRLRFFDGEGVRKVDRDLAKARGARGKLGCRYSPQGCEAIRAGRKRNMLVRLHASHEMRDAICRAERLGADGLRGVWSEARLKKLREYAQALALAEVRSQEA